MLKYTYLYLQLDQSNRKNVFDTVDHFESLSEYYHDKFTNFFRVKNLKALLGQDDYTALISSINKWMCTWGKWGDECIPMTQEVTEKIAESLNPHYESVINHIEYMLDNMINTVEVGGVYNCVLLGIIKLKRENDEVKAYIRKSLKLPKNKKNRMNDAYILNEKKWAEVDKVELLSDCANDLIHEMISCNSSRFIATLFGIATHIEFFKGTASHLGVLGIDTVGDMDFPARNILKFLSKNFYIKERYWSGGKLVYSRNKRGMFVQIAGLYMLVAKSSGYLRENSSLYFLKNNEELVHQAIERIFNFNNNEVAVSAYDALMLNSPHSSPYQVENIAKYVEREVFFHKYKIFLDLFGNDCGKLTYLFCRPDNRDFFGPDSKKPLEEKIKDDYFSYKYLISNNPFDLKVFTFPSKSAVRVFYGLDAKLIANITLSCRETNVRCNKVVLWRNIMFFLHHFNTNIKNLTVDSFKKAKNHIMRLCEKYPIEKIDGDVCARIAKAVELILELAVSEDYESLHELTDYINGSKYKLDHKNKWVRSRQKNILDVNKRMSLKQAMILQNEWHIALIEYEIQQDLKKISTLPNNKKYAHLKPVDVLIDGVQFQLILNQYELKKEMQLLKHCVLTYHNKIKDKNYIVFALTDKNIGTERNTVNAYTMGCNAYGNGYLGLDQIRGFCNSIAPSSIKLAVSKFLSQCAQGEINIYAR